MKKTVLITGANRGIGLALVNYYLSSGCKVYGVCRQSNRELDTSGAEVIQGIDVATDESSILLKQHLDGIIIDLLINNAGVLHHETLDNLNFDSILQQFQINSLGPLRVTNALIGNLQKGSKVALITSRMGSIADNSSGGYYGYRMSKAALNAAGMSLARDLTPSGIPVAILHPGFVATEMVGGRGDISPSLAAERLAQRITDLTLASSGTFWHSNGEVLPW
jgi:NAD(P)-dependent dehydrogenase (short-subunit alcohol dehydrogenase family)